MSALLRRPLVQMTVERLRTCGSQEYALNYRLTLYPKMVNGRGRDEDFSSPPHRSRRALLTHRAPPSGSGVEAVTFAYPQNDLATPSTPRCSTSRAVTPGPTTACRPPMLWAHFSRKAGFTLAGPLVAALNTASPRTGRRRSNTCSPATTTKTT